MQPKKKSDEIFRETKGGSFFEAEKSCDVTGEFGFADIGGQTEAVAALRDVSDYVHTPTLCAACVLYALGGAPGVRCPLSFVFQKKKRCVRDLTGA